jgi:hypothetical protein
MVPAMAPAFGVRHHVSVNGIAKFSCFLLAGSLSPVPKRVNVPVDFTL